MRDLAGRVAVITGAARGIGLALAERCAREGMALVLADIDAPALEGLQTRFSEQGVAVHGVVCDVSQESAVLALAEEAFAHFPNVHLLCNNAGIFLPGRSWEIDTATWERVLGVNLWGVIHGVRAFLPRMLAHGETGHIVNTASVAGIITSPRVGAPYTVSKHAVLAYSEVLYKELRELGAPIGVTALCPAWVHTDIIAAAARKLAGDDERAGTTSALQDAMDATGVTPQEVASHVMDAVLEDQFYAMPGADPDIYVAPRWDTLYTQRNPAV
jgi:NAD(P)-dependent dehydrogenase (short-subunit alcohol dehydrogenase family)